MKASDIDLQIDPKTPPVPTTAGVTVTSYPEGSDGSVFNVEYSDPQHVQIIDSVAELSTKLDHVLEHLHKLEAKLSGGLKIVSE